VVDHDPGAAQFATHARSGGVFGAWCRRSCHPEGQRSFEQITLPPQPRLLRSEIGELIDGEPVALTALDAFLVDPVPEGAVVHADRSRHVRDRSVLIEHHRHRIPTELERIQRRPPPNLLPLPC
jgi:hypothetical protein